MSKFKTNKYQNSALRTVPGFCVEDGYKLKYLRMATSEGECCIKLCKQLRADFELRLIPGDWLQVVVKKKLDKKTGLLKLKAERVVPAATSYTETLQLRQHRSKARPIFWCVKV